MKLTWAADGSRLDRFLSPAVVLPYSSIRRSSSRTRQVNTPVI